MRAKSSKQRCPALCIPGKIFKKKPFEVEIYTAIAQERKGIERSNWVKLVFR